MKVYTIAREMGGALGVSVETNTAGKKRNEYLKYALPFVVGKLGFDIGNASEEAKNLALSLMSDYYEGAPEEAERKVDAFLGAFLVHHPMGPGAKLEISSETLDRWIFLLQIPVGAR